MQAAQRTKDALQAAKARGVVLGNPKLHAVRDRAVAIVKADADRFAKNVAPIIREIQSTGVASHRGIARSLNARGVTTARGGVWTAVQVGSILRRAGIGGWRGAPVAPFSLAKQRPDLILMDIQLPIMDGYTAACDQRLIDRAEWRRHGHYGKIITTEL